MLKIEGERTAHIGIWRYHFCREFLRDAGDYFYDAFAHGMDSFANDKHFTAMIVTSARASDHRLVIVEHRCCCEHKTVVTWHE